ncbi:hypothetical protein SAMN04487751_1065 [Microbacterium saccharophilum]|nr:hypothetical protein SAMN04487751_1065 [Microbacterium saccharophilum]
MREVGRRGVRGTLLVLTAFTALTATAGGVTLM